MPRRLAAGGRPHGKWRMHMKDIKATISDDMYRRLQDYPDKPRQKWGKHNTPEFYANACEHVAAMD
jgi:hypothetical protein